jgi:tetratricopeptide (TPR) repeat protein
VDSPEAALPHLEWARELDPASGAGLLELSECYRKLDRTREAIDALVELHRLRPLEEQPLYLLHAMLLAAQQDQEGLELFRGVALEVRPYWPFAHEALGDFLLHSGDPRRAEVSYLRALELGSRHTNLQRKLDLARRKALELSDARRASTADPGLPLPASPGTSP